MRKKTLITLAIIVIAFNYATAITITAKTTIDSTQDVSIIAQNALKEFHSLSRADKKVRIKEAKKYWHENKKAAIQILILFYWPSLPFYCRPWQYIFMKTSSTVNSG